MRDQKGLPDPDPVPRIGNPARLNAAHCVTDVARTLQRARPADAGAEAPALQHRESALANRWSRWLEGRIDFARTRTPLRSIRFEPEVCAGQEGLIQVGRIPDGRFDHQPP